jgi:3'-5' exoribonuclease
MNQMSIREVRQAATAAAANSSSSSSGSQSQAGVSGAAAAGPVSASVHAQLDRVQVKPTKSGSEYLELKLADAGDQFVLRVWGDAPAFPIIRPLPPGSFLAISGDWTSGQYGLEPRQWTARLLEPEERAALLGGPPALREKQETDFATIGVLVDGMADPRLRALCRLFLEEYGERLRRTGAARDYHHARRGGLVEHVAQMMRSASALAEVYPGTNRDLLLAGVLFHDCGKLWENCYEKEGFAMPYSEPAELLGHISLGIELVNRLWRRLMDSPQAAEWKTAPSSSVAAPASASSVSPPSASDPPAAAHPPASSPASSSASNPAASAAMEPPTEAVRLHLLHLIGAHHGEYQFGSPVLPRTPEAVLLHHVDNIDAKLEMLADSYATSALLAPNIFERRRPMPGNAVRPLPVFVNPEAAAADHDWRNSDV